VASEELKDAERVLRSATEKKDELKRDLEQAQNNLVPQVETRMVGIKDHSSGLQIDFLCRCSTPLEQGKFTEAKVFFENFVDQRITGQIGKKKLLTEFLGIYCKDLEYREGAEDDLVKFFTDQFNEKEGGGFSNYKKNLSDINKDIKRTIFTIDLLATEKIGDILLRLKNILSIFYFSIKRGYNPGELGYGQSDNFITEFFILIGLHNETILWLLIYFQIYIAKIYWLNNNVYDIYKNKIIQGIKRGLEEIGKPQEEIDEIDDDFIEIFLILVRETILNPYGIYAFREIGAQPMHILRKIEITQYLFKEGLQGIINLLDLYVTQFISGIKDKTITDMTDMTGLFNFKYKFLDQPLLFSQLERNKDSQLLKFTDEEINETTWEMVDKKNNAAIKLQSAMRGYRVRKPSSGGSGDSSTDDIERFERVGSIYDYNEDHYHKYYYFSLP